MRDGRGSRAGYCNIRARIRAVVADQNLEGYMLGSELAVFACKMFPRMNLISATIRSSSPDRSVPAKAFLAARSIDGGARWMNRAPLADLLLPCATLR
jgi:hypothetical protein